jgi:hypothetical protein
MRQVLALATALMLYAAAYAQAPSKPTRVLFVGNAVVSGGGFASRLAKVAEATGRNVSVEVVASNAYALEDHAKDGKAMEALRRGFDVVVMQQDPPTAGERGEFVREVKQLADSIRAAGAKPALFMMWPRADRPQAFRDTITVHRAAAEASGAVLVPAAEAWLRALGEDKRLKLYTGEGAQAATLGNDLAVMTTFFALFPAGPQEFDEAYLRKIGGALEIPSSTRDLLVDAATRAIDEPLALSGKRSP